MLRRILASSRYLIIIAVIGTFITALTTLIDGGILSVRVVSDVINYSAFTADEAKHLSVEVIEVIDLFLLGTVLYIISLGLYELFIDKDLPVPSWLTISTLDDLKGRLVGVIIVLLAVTFLSYVVTWDGNINILAVGVAVGLVLFALGSFFGPANRAHREPQK